MSYISTLSTLIPQGSVASSNTVWKSNSYYSLKYNDDNNNDYNDNSNNSDQKYQNITGGERAGGVTKRSQKSRSQRGRWHEKKMVQTEGAQKGSNYSQHKSSMVGSRPTLT